MVGIVLISHSHKIVDGVRDLALEMAPTVPIEIAGGTLDGRIGTDMMRIVEAIENIYSDDGVIALFDLGSAFMNAEMAIECIGNKESKNIRIIDAPLVEGAIIAAVQSSIGKNIDEIDEVLKEIKLGKIS